MSKSGTRLSAGYVALREIDQLLHKAWDKRAGNYKDGVSDTTIATEVAEKLGKPISASSVAGLRKQFGMLLYTKRATARQAGILTQDDLQDLETALQVNKRVVVVRGKKGLKVYELEKYTTMQSTISANTKQCKPWMMTRHYKKHQAAMANGVMVAA